MESSSRISERQHRLIGRIIQLYVGDIIIVENRTLANFNLVSVSHLLWKIKLEIARALFNNTPRFFGLSSLDIVYGFYR